MTLGDRVVVMKDGRVQQVGEPLELYGRPANRFVAGFIGSPAMNFVDVSDQRGERRALGGSPGLARPGARQNPGPARPAAGSRSGVRPEALRLANGTRRRRLQLRRPRSTWSSRSATRSCSTSAPAGCRWWRASTPAGGAGRTRTVRFALDPARLHFFDAKSEAEPNLIAVADAHLHVWDPQAHYYPWLCDPQPIAVPLRRLQRAESGLPRRRLPRRQRGLAGGARRLRRGRMGSARPCWGNDVHSEGSRNRAFPTVAIAQAWLITTIAQPCSRHTRDILRARHPPQAEARDDGRREMARRVMRASRRSGCTSSCRRRGASSTKRRARRDFPDTGIVLNHTGACLDEEIPGWKSAMAALPPART